MPCPSCGAQVSKNAATCAVCGESLVESAVAGVSSRLGSGQQEAYVASGPLRAPDLGPERCPACAAALERDAKFCSGCGATVHTGEFASPPLPDEEASFEEDEDVVIPHELVAEPSFEPIPDRDAEFNRTGPVPVVREPAPAEPWAAWVPAVAIGFALFALLIAMLVHVFGPSSLPNYSPAEVSLKVQMRAVEWLLAGILAAVVGMIAKR